MASSSQASLDSLLKPADSLSPINITAVVTAATAKGAADALAKVNISPAFGVKRLDSVGKSLGWVGDIDLLSTLQQRELNWQSC